MLYRISQRIVRTWQSEQIIPSESSEAYVYGVQLLLSTLVNIFCIAVVSVLAALPLAWIPFLVGFVPLRVSAGGFHAKTPLRCFITFCGTYLIFIALVLHLHDAGIRLAILTNSIVTVLTVYLCSPTLLMLCVGFLFLITTANSYGVLWQELDTPYVLPGTVTGQADLEKYLEVPSVEAVTPVLSFETKLTAKDAALSGTVTAVLADYLELSFAQGGPFPNDTNMPFLVLNEYASKNFLTESKSKVPLAVNDTLTMTIGEEEQSAILCGIFEDGLEQPVIYMSYTLAARVLPKGESINLLLRLGKTEDLESESKALKKLGVSVSYDETLPERWKLTKQQIYQTFLSALVLLLCSAVQIMGQHKREQTVALSERQALALGGLEERQLLWIFPLRTFFADLFSLLVAIAVAGIMGGISLIGLLAGGIGCAAHLGIVMSPSSSHRNCIQ